MVYENLVLLLDFQTIKIVLNIFKKREKICCVGKKQIDVHRLVALLYVPNPKNKRFVSHISANLLHNDFYNLIWTNKTCEIKLN